MAQGTNYKVAFRRRREGKTDYAARMKLVDYDKSRLVVRVSNSHATVQVINYLTSKKPPAHELAEQAAAIRSKINLIELITPTNWRNWC